MDKSNDPRHNFYASPTMDETQEPPSPAHGSLWRIAYDRDLCMKWAEVTIAAQARGRRIDCADAWIAATALPAEAPLMTHNRNDYLGVRGLTIISHAQ